MVGLRLHELEVAGVCPSLSVEVPAGDVRAAVVPGQRAVPALANVVVGLDEPHAGRVLVDGTDVGQQQPGAVVLEDGPDMPSWDVVLADHRSTAPSQDACAGREPFDDVACFLITTDAARAWVLDDDPVGVGPGGC